MAKTKTSSAVKQRYNAKAYDRLAITIPKGRKQAIEAHAQSKGQSVNGLVNELIRSDMGLSESEWKQTLQTPAE
jgi:iron uptake system EfeUOB component EfeO/EfeM